MLGLIEEVTQSAPSSAVSIPETPSEPATDSQDEYQVPNTQDYIASTPDTIESSSQFVQASLEYYGDEEHPTQSESLAREGVLTISEPTSPSVTTDDAAEITQESEVQGNQSQASEASEPREATPEIAESTSQDIASSEHQAQAATAAQSSSQEPSPAIEIAESATQIVETVEEPIVEPKTVAFSSTDSVATGTSAQLPIGFVSTSERASVGASERSQLKGIIDSQAGLTENELAAELIRPPLHYLVSPDTVSATQSSHSRDTTSTKVLAPLDLGEVPRSVSQLVTREALNSTSTVRSQSTHDAELDQSVQSTNQLPVPQHRSVASTHESLLPEPAHLSAPPVIAPTQPAKQVSSSSLAPQACSEPQTAGTIIRRDFAVESQPPKSASQITDFREQNAQLVPQHQDLSSQEDVTQSIRSTVELERTLETAPRYDSSQETSGTHSGLENNSPSPIPDPPGFSLGIVTSTVPPRPLTPVLTVSQLIMTSPNIAELLEQRLQEASAQEQAANPFIPRPRRSGGLVNTFSPAAPEGSRLAVVSARRLPKPHLSQAALEGTRSPSSVPAHAPTQPSTSLIAVAVDPSSSAPVSGLNVVDTIDSVGILPVVDDNNDMDTAGEAIALVDDPMTTESDGDESSNVDDDADDEDSESLLNDDLQLDSREYIVPLFIEGMQRDMYSQKIIHHATLLNEFVSSTNDHPDLLTKVEDVLAECRAIESHTDLVFAEAAATSMAGDTPVDFAVDYGIQLSVKFRFLYALFTNLREESINIALVTEQDNNELFHILEEFCKVKEFNYSIPTKGRQADLATVRGKLTVTIFPGDASPIIRAPHVVICLDGFQEASQLRAKNWNRVHNGGAIPTIHLVIPRTVGHIERYLPAAQERRKRVHTTVASLSQFRGELGRAIDDKTPTAADAAYLVSVWLSDSGEPRTWPLPSIGSIKDIIEYQISQASPTPPAPERHKRPLVSKCDQNPCRHI